MPHLVPLLTAAAVAASTPVPTPSSPTAPLSLIPASAAVGGTVEVQAKGAPAEGSCTLRVQGVVTGTCQDLLGTISGSFAVPAGDLPSRTVTVTVAQPVTRVAAFRPWVAEATLAVIAPTSTRASTTTTSRTTRTATPSHTTSSARASSSAPGGSSAASSPPVQHHPGGGPPIGVLLAAAGGTLCLALLVFWLLRRHEARRRGTLSVRAVILAGSITPPRLVRNRTGRTHSVGLRLRTDSALHPRGG